MAIVPWALSVWLVSSAQATVVVPADVATVVSGSDVIAHGRVIEVRSTTTSDRRTIYSLVTLAVDEALKGRPGSTVTFRVPNGQVGRYRRIVIGAPEFSVGEDVVVFLHGQAPAMPTLFGLSQGVYRVPHDEPSRQRVADSFIRSVRALAGRAR
jgi:hypothetical protein